MSQVSVDAIIPQSGSTITIGGSGDTVNLGSGASSSGFGVAVAGIVGVSTFTSSGTWTKATRESALGVTIKRVIVEVQGGGGSGSDGNAASARYTHGGAGGYAKKLIDVSSISSATITVGAGGAGVTSYPSNAGGDSIWSDGTNTVTGGGAGAAGTANYVGGLGGTASGGDLNIDGRTGGGYAMYSGTDSMFGFGGTYSARQTGSTSTGSDEPTGYGSGSAGLYGNGTTRDGRPGIVIVWEYA